MKLFLKPCLFFLLYVPFVCQSNELFENHHELKNQASAYLLNLLDASNGEHEISIQNIDQRLKLKKCPNTIDIQLTTDQVKSGKNTLKISCASITPWRIFISAKVKLFSTVVVANHPISRGHQLQASDLILQRKDLSLLRSSYFNDKQQAINYITKRHLNRGDVLSLKHLTRPILIKKGDTVTIIVENDGFQISMKGVALNNAAKNELIRVKNSQSKKIVQGIAVNRQTVKVNL